MGSKSKSAHACQLLKQFHEKYSKEFLQELLKIYDYGNWSIHPGPLDWNLIKDG